MWDADGGFGITIIKVSDLSVDYRVCLKAKMELRAEYHRLVDPSMGSTSYYDIMSAIGDYFGVHVRAVTRIRNGNSYYSYVVEAGGKNSHSIVASYFEHFPLFSSAPRALRARHAAPSAVLRGKYFNYLRWLEVHQMQLFA